MPALVTTRSDGDVLVVTLDNPARRNVLDPDLTAQLRAALDVPSSVGAVALLAAGDHFCVGGDVSAFGSAPDPAAYVGSLATAFHEVVRAMQSAPPIVVGHRGWAAGAGMSVLLAADVVVSGTSASMRPAYPGIGVTPDGGMTWTLPRLVGQRRALAILLGNDVLSAEEAFALGLVNEVVDDDAVDARALELAQSLAASATGSMVGIKRLVRESVDRPLTEQLDAEAASIAACAASPEG
ncbi:enoyl-CoA hydratase/isomerase family protein, partial [Jatrophihabitans endophyticus]|uniref:enoyl-CoA hydratase/isomerase family protein n=1 Tax=Jatrophihabitans endophyticus TaxID=1206085 RepID=UPI0026ED47A9